MKRDGKRKLELNRETIRALTTHEMSAIAGGQVKTGHTCTCTCLCKTWDCPAPPLTAQGCKPPSTVILV